MSTTTRNGVLVVITAVLIIAPPCFVIGLHKERPQSISGVNAEKEPQYLGKPYSYWRNEVEEWTRFDDACWWSDGGNMLDAPDHEDPPSDLVIELIRSKQWRPDDPFPYESIDANNEDLMKLLTHLLQDKKRQVQVYAMYSLRPFKSKAKAATPTLIAMLDERDDYVREWAIKALGEIGPDASDACPKLLDILKDNKRGYRKVGVRRAAAEALKQIDEDLAEKSKELFNIRLDDSDFEEFERQIGIPKEKSKEKTGDG